MLTKIQVFDAAGRLKIGGKTTNSAYQTNWEKVASLQQTFLTSVILTLILHYSLANLPVE